MSPHRTAQSVMPRAITQWTSNYAEQIINAIRLRCRKQNVYEVWLLTP